MKTQILLTVELANWPMMKLLEEKQRAGMMANGSWMAITMLKKSFSIVTVDMSAQKRTMAGGKSVNSMAIKFLY